MEHKLTFTEYNGALKENRLLGLKCKSCGAITVPPKVVCRQCTGSELDIIELKGNGKIRTFTTVNVASEGREEEVPYTIVMVELEEGPWLMGNLDGIDPGDVSMEIIGKPVKMSHRVFEGDKYSAGEGICPIFSLSEPS
jgi:uncharacterized OB-fold protein